MPIRDIAFPVTEELKNKLRAYHAEWPGSWGSLHIAMEDGNMETENVEFCRQYATDNNDPEGAELAEMLLKISFSARMRLYRDRTI